MEDALRLTVIIILLNIGLVAYFLTGRLLFPRRIAKTRMVAEATPGRSFGVGLVNFAFFGAIAMVLLSVADRVGNGVIKTIITLPALFFLVVLGIGLSFGVCAMAELVGERLAPAQTAFRRTVWGTLVVSFGSSLPFVGWFILLPYVGLVGLGAFILGFFWKEQATVS